jgi:hypothetical protein
MMGGMGGGMGGMGMGGMGMGMMNVADPAASSQESDDFNSETIQNRKKKAPHRD